MLFVFTDYRMFRHDHKENAEYLAVIDIYTSDCKNKML